MSLLLHEKSWMLLLEERLAAHERGFTPTATVHPCPAMRARLDATGAVTLGAVARPRNVRASDSLMGLRIWMWMAERASRCQRAGSDAQTTVSHTRG